MSPDPIPLRPVPEGACFHTVMHMTFETGGLLIQECREIEGLSCKTETPKVGGRWGDGVTTFFAREQEFDNLESALAALGYQRVAKTSEEK